MVVPDDGNVARGREKEGEWGSFLAGRVCVIALQANGLLFPHKRICEVVKAG